MAMTSAFGRRASAIRKRNAAQAKAVKTTAPATFLPQLANVAQDFETTFPQEGFLLGDEPHQLMPYEYEAPSGTHPTPEVVVVGGGLAGLMAGWMLASQGFHITVLEAQPKVGGRVCTQHSGDRVLEVGGELIGIIHTRWVKLAKHFNLGLSPISTEVMYGWQGLDLPLLINNKKQENDMNELTKAYASLNKHANYVDAYQPWTCDRAAEWDSMSVQTWITDLKKNRQISAETATVLEYELSTNQASPTSKQSYLGLLTATRGGSHKPLPEDGKTAAPYWGDACETFRCSSGNQRLAKEMAHACKLAGGEVRTRAAVTSIEQTAAGWIVSTTSSKRNKKYKADWIVLAIPPSVLGRIEFEPTEVRERISDLSRFQVGPAVKYFAPVKERFWLSGNLAPAAEDTEFGIVWENTDNQNVELSARKSLTVFTGGPLADSSRWKSDRDKYFQGRLNKIYDGFKEQVDREKCWMADWPTYKWTRCGYSCPGLGQVVDISQYFAQPLGQLVFAGEHTSSAFFGFMEGALESGLRAAQLIFQKVGVEPTPIPSGDQ